LYKITDKNLFPLIHKYINVLNFNQDLRLKYTLNSLKLNE